MIAHLTLPAVKAGAQCQLLYGLLCSGQLNPQLCSTLATVLIPKEAECPVSSAVWPHSPMGAW